MWQTQSPSPRDSLDHPWLWLIMWAAWRNTHTICSTLMYTIYYIFIYQYQNHINIYLYNFVYIYICICIYIYMYMYIFIYTSCTANIPIFVFPITCPFFAFFRLWGGLSNHGFAYSPCLTTLPTRGIHFTGSAPPDDYFVFLLKGICRILSCWLYTTADIWYVMSVMLSGEEVFQRSEVIHHHYVAGYSVVPWWFPGQKSCADFWGATSFCR